MCIWFDGVFFNFCRWKFFITIYYKNKENSEYKVKMAQQCLKSNYDIWVMMSLETPNNKHIFNWGNKTLYLQNVKCFGEQKKRRKKKAVLSL